MAPAWEKLANDYAGSSVTLVAEVDCTTEEDLCETFDVQGFPTINWGDANDLQDYAGGRDYDSLKEFAKEHLEKPICSIHNKDACSQEQQSLIRDLEKKTPDELHAIVEKFEKDAEEADAVLQAEIERIEEEYEKAVGEHTKTVEKMKESSGYMHVMALMAQMEDKVEEEF